MQTVRISDDQVPGVEVVAEVDRDGARGVLVRSVTFSSTASGGLSPGDVAAFSVAVAAFSVASVAGAPAGGVQASTPAKRPARAVKSSPVGSRPAAKKTTKPVPARKTTAAKAPAKKVSRGGKVATESRQFLTTAAGSADDRPYRRLPDDFPAVYSGVNGSIQSLVAHFDVPRHTIRTWIKTAQNAGTIPAR